MAIGKQIKIQRKRQHLTQKQLAEKTGIAEITIRQYEAGKYNPKINALNKLCIALDCKITDLIDADSKKYYRLFDNEKTLDEIDYDHSYSFSSSDDDLNNIQDEKQRELEKHRAKPFKLHETDDPSKPFTCPLQSSYDEPNDSHNDNSLKLHTNTRGIDWEQLDDFRFDELMHKLAHGEILTQEELNFKSAYLERTLRKIGNIFAKFYSMLNAEGQKKADEQIDRALEQVELLTKIPEYQKKPPEPPQE